MRTGQKNIRTGQKNIIIIIISIIIINSSKQVRTHEVVLDCRLFLTFNLGLLKMVPNDTETKLLLEVVLDLLQPIQAVLDLQAHLGAS